MEGALKAAHSGLGAALLCLVIGCARPPHPIEVGAFNATNAFHHVEYLVNLGPRPSGSAAIRQAGDYIRDELKRYDLTVEEQSFHAGTPRGPMEFRNLIARTRSSRRGGTIILGSHYDTPHLEGIRMVGANDAGSSVGALLELARLLCDQPDLAFVFFDGEEIMVQASDDDGLWGSRYFVKLLQADQQVHTVQAMVLLDMVGDADLNITLPADSSGPLVEQVFRAAQSLGYRDRFSYRTTELIDDHLPFFQAGIPAVDIIDYEFGSAPGRNDYWHTAQDTLDKIRPRSLEIVGQTTLRLVELLRK